jgi:hypothetical protein
VQRRDLDELERRREVRECVHLEHPPVVLAGLIAEAALASLVSVNPLQGDTLNYVKRDEPTVRETLDVVRQAEVTLHALKALRALDDPRAKDVEETHAQQIAITLSIVGGASNRAPHAAQFVFAGLPGSVGVDVPAQALARPSLADDREFAVKGAASLTEESSHGAVPALASAVKQLRAPAPANRLRLDAGVIDRPYVVERHWPVDYSASRCLSRLRKRCRGAERNDRDQEGVPHQRIVAGAAIFAQRRIGRVARQLVC